MIVVGAGPAGLTAAITLARSGVDCIVVERRHELSSLPRATVVSTRSMELIRAWGIEHDVRAGGDAVEWLLWDCPTLADAANGAGDRGRLSEHRRSRRWPARHHPRASPKTTSNASC